MAQSGTPLGQALDPESGDWSRTDGLLAALIDQIAALRWESSDRTGPRPEPICPWVSPEKATDVEVYRGDPMTFEEADELAARLRAKPQQKEADR